MKTKIVNEFHRVRSRLAKIYARYEKVAPVVFFLGGFLYDSLTLTRIDRLWDNLILLLYILAAGALILLLGLLQTGQLRHPRLLQIARYLPGALQFFLGGLFSAYVIFYFQSAALAKSLVFVAVLVVLLLANEFLHHKLVNITLLCTLYFFAVFAFLTFFIPVVSHKLSRASFFSSGGAALLLAAGLVTAIHRRIFRREPVKLLQISSPMLLIFGLMSFFYLANWIPPVPLALKDSGIYHHVHRAGRRYVVRYWRNPGWAFWDRSDSRFPFVKGDTVFCFAAVFAPFDMTANVYYRWQLWDARRERWLQTDLLKYRISGGREGGYRGYTYKRNVQPGRWRVQVETEIGQVLGRVYFRVTPKRGDRGREITALK